MQSKYKLAAKECPNSKNDPPSVMLARGGGGGGGGGGGCANFVPHHILVTAL